MQAASAMVHASPSVPTVAPPLVELAPPLVELAPPEPEPPLLLWSHAGQFDVAHSPTASVALKHALDVDVLPAEPWSQLEQKLAYCELHLLSTQLTHAGDVSGSFCAAAQVELLSELLQASPLRPVIKAMQKGISFFM